MAMVFFSTTAVAKFPLSGGVKYTGVGKFCDFRPEIAVYLGNGIRDKPMHRKSQVADRSVSVPMTSSDLIRRDMKGQVFLGFTLRSYGLTHSDQIWCDNTGWGEACFKGHPCPIGMRPGLSVPKLLGPPSYTHTV